MRPPEISAEISYSSAPIPPQALPHIFERFYRVDTARTRSNSAGSETTPSGYGLGLAIAKAIADQHHATLSASSSAENGTTFSLFLPTAES